MKGSDTPENRNLLAERESDLLKSTLTLSETSRSNAHEGFEPILVAGEVIDNHFI